MKKYTNLFFIILLIMALLYAIPSKAENILTTSGIASINAEPDTAMLILAIETENKLLNQALKENTEKARKVTGEIKKIIGKNDSIKTTGFNVNPVYNYDNKERKSILSGYRVTNTINIKTSKISDVGKIIDKAINCGANRANDLDFIVEHKEKYSGDLLKKASEQAKQKAYATAEALGVTIKGIQRISTNFSNEAISPYFRQGTFAISDMEMKNSSAAPPIEAGEVKLNATVTVDFIIENLK